MLKGLCVGVAIILLNGCIGSLADKHTLYEIKMLTGDSLYTRAKPKLDNDGYYRFQDVNEQSYIVNSKTVLLIEPVPVSR